MGLRLQILGRLALRSGQQPTHDRLQVRVSSAANVKAHPVRKAALSRHTAPAFSICAGLETLQLRRLDDFAYRLFHELLTLADFTSGQIRVTYAVLISLMDFDRTPGAHAKPLPTKQRLRTAIEALCELKLIRELDRQRNERAGGLFFRVAPRGGISAANERSNTGSNTPRKPAKQATARVPAMRAPEEQHEEPTRVQERALPSKSPSLSTVSKPSKYVLESRAIVAATKARRAGFK